ncbi:MAG TPA: TolC family protein, partial [Treponemataceae bacterium]|nr:TolC family protein [Treponemataceae bacterium]
ALLMPNLILQYKADPVLNNPAENALTDSGNWRQSSGALSLTIAWDLTSFIPMSDYQVKRLQLKDNLSLARLSAQDTMRKAADETENKRRAIEASRANVENFTRSLESAKRAYELNEITYRAGSGRLLDLQDAELYSQQAEVTLLSEKLKLIALALDWDAEFSSDAAPKGQGQVAP